MESCDPFNGAVRSARPRGPRQLRHPRLAGRAKVPAAAAPATARKAAQDAGLDPTHPAREEAVQAIGSTRPSRSRGAGVRSADPRAAPFDGMHTLLDQETPDKAAVLAQAGTIGRLPPPRGTRRCSRPCSPVGAKLSRATRQAEGMGKRMAARGRGTGRGRSSDRGPAGGAEFCGCGRFCFSSSVGPTACAVRPDYVRPPTPSGDAWQAPLEGGLPRGAAGGSGAAGSFWQVLHDPLL